MKKLSWLASLFACGITWLAGTADLSAQLPDQPRPLAPGVLKVVAPEIEPADTFSPFLRIPGLASQPFAGNYIGNSQTLHGQTQRVVYFRNVWAYEFATLGLRQIELDFATPQGNRVSRHFYYLVYRVRNLGTTLTYEQAKKEADGFVQLQLKRNEIPEEATPPGPGKFRPEFSLEGWLERGEVGLSKVAYVDRYLPAVARAIQELEDPNRRLYDKFEIENIEIPLAETADSPGVWGVAIWENVNPNANFLAVYVQGLTNAYQIQADANGEQRLLNKVLKLNFYRPGDAVLKVEDQISLGVPLIDKPEEQVVFCQRYELPGPQFEIALTNQTILGERKVAEVDAAVDWSTFDSPEVLQLDGGELPESLATALTEQGFSVPAGSAPKVEVPSVRWTLDLEVDGENRTFAIRFAPRFWEKSGEGIRFIRSLDYFWLYR